MSAFWSYLSTSPHTLWPQSSCICARNRCPKLGDPRFPDASQNQVNLILVHTPRTWVLSNDVPVVICGGRMSLLDNAGGIQDGFCEYYAIYRQQPVGWKLWQSQCRTKLEGQDGTVSSQYSQERYTSYCAWAYVECKCLYLRMDMPLSQYQFVVFPKYDGWNYDQNSFTELTLIYDLQLASLDIQNVLHPVQCFSWPPESLLPSTKFQTSSSGSTIPSGTASAHSKWYNQSLSVGDLEWCRYQQYTRW